MIRILQYFLFLTSILIMSLAVFTIYQLIIPVMYSFPQDAIAQPQVIIEILDYPKAKLFCYTVYKKRHCMKIQDVKGKK